MPADFFLGTDKIMLENPHTKKTPNKLEAGTFLNCTVFRSDRSGIIRLFQNDGNTQKSKPPDSY